MSKKEGGVNDIPAGGEGMDPKEWAIQAFDTCDHGGMICMNCAEKAIKAAIEEERAREHYETPATELPAQELPPHSVPAAVDLAL